MREPKTRKCVYPCSRTGRGPQVYCLMRFLEGFRFSTIFKPKNHRSVRSVARFAQLLHKHVDVTRAHARCKRHRHARMDAQLHLKAGGRSRAHTPTRTHTLVHSYRLRRPDRRRRQSACCKAPTSTRGRLRQGAEVRGYARPSPCARVCLRGIKKRLVSGRSRCRSAG